MLPLHQFIVLFILLSVSKSPKDAQEFARIRGEWDVIGMETMGKQIPAELWRGKTIVIASTSGMKQQPGKSMAYWGRLNLRRSRPTIQSRFITVSAPEQPRDAQDDPQIPDYPPVPPVVMGTETHMIYEVDGDNLRLLITQVVGKEDVLPKTVQTDANSRGTLYLLRRKKTWRTCP